MTKAIKALEIFKAEVTTDEAPSKELRQKIIDRFINELEMTPAGAATYFANSKNKAKSGFVTPVQRKSAKPTATHIKVREKTQSEVDSLAIYSICVPGTNEKGEKVLDSTNSFYSLNAAKHQCGKDELVVKGMPKLEQPWSKLKPI
jgi:hypothetical protein